MKSIEKVPLDALFGSLPVRERGLKCFPSLAGAVANYVAPRAGAWIEIVAAYLAAREADVAPRAGAWIEILGIRFLSKRCHCRSPCGSVD